MTGRGLRIAIGAALVLLAVGLWLVTLVPGWMSRNPATAETAPAATPAPDSARRIKATLFYVSEDGSELVPSTRDVPYGETAAEQARHILNAQVRTPPDGFATAIPAGTAVRGVFVGTKGEMYVDLSPEVTSGYAGGTLDEALAVFAIVNAVTVNLPTVTAVQILVDGKEVDSLGGHIDLREPIARSDAWVRKGQ
jgi:spore germination protein GerM